MCVASSKNLLDLCAKSINLHTGYYCFLALTRVYYAYSPLFFFSREPLNASIDLFCLYLYQFFGIIPIVSDFKKFRRDTMLQTDAMVMDYMKMQTFVLSNIFSRNFKQAWVRITTSDILYTMIFVWKLNVEFLFLSYHFKNFPLSSLFMLSGSEYTTSGKEPT